MSTFVMLPPNSHIKKVMVDQLELAGTSVSSKRTQGSDEHVYFAKIAEGIMKVLLDDPGAREELRRLLAPTQELDGDQWISSQDAADLMGFSRPYVNAILDSSEFKGEVMRREGGHRRVKVSSIRQWMKDHSVRPAATKEDILSLRKAIDPAFYDEPELSADERLALRKELDEGIRESLKHRPKRG